MQNQINFPAVLEHYSNMSEGDKSCVTAMLEKPGAQQMTSIGKPHDKFYEELSKSGWAKSVEIPKPLLEENKFRAWKLTEIGFKSMTTLLLALTTANIRNEYHKNRYTERAKFGFKLLVCYMTIQTLLYLTFLGFKQLNVSISLSTDTLSLIALSISLITSLLITCKILFQKEISQSRVKKIAYYEFLSSEIRPISILSAITILFLHLIFEFTAPQFGFVVELKSNTKFLIQCVILSGIVWMITETFLPAVLKDQHDKQFKADKSNQKNQ